MSDFNISIKNYLKGYKAGESQAPALMYKVSTTKGEFFVVPSPTANCQVMSLYNIGPILYQNESRPDYDITKDEFKQVLSRIKRDTENKHLIFCDIKHKYINKLDSLIKECEFQVIFKNEYVSTNKSNMCMYLINTINVPKADGDRVVE